MTVIRLIVATVAPVRPRRWPAVGRGRLRATTGIVLAATLLLTASCSDDDSTASDSTESTTTSRPTTTESDPETTLEDSNELEDQIQDLLRSYDEVLGEIGAQPQVASDRESPAYDDLRALLAPESPMTEPLINGLVAAGSRGERQLATGGHRFPVERIVGGRVRPVSDSEFKVIVCGQMNYGVFNGQNQQIELAEGHVESSDATIVRVDNDLRIERFEVLESERCQEAER